MSYGKATAAPSHITDLIFIGSRRHAANLTADNPSAINAVLNVGSGRYARAISRPASASSERTSIKVAES
jgi:hypothetical protein